MRFTFLFSCLCIHFNLLYGQTSLKELDLSFGSFSVGFTHYTKIDSTRTYRIKNEFNNEYIFRPIPISIWYPAKLEGEQQEQMTVLNYLEILKKEEEWENLPNQYLLDWFHYLWNTPENQSHLPEKAQAYSNIPFLDGQYPVVVYAASYQASSIENFALCEYLASHGFVVISSPSRGMITRQFEGGTTKDMETQSRDIEILLKEIYRYRYIDTEKIALMGFSFGGLSNAITVMKYPSIKALVSLDGTERYNYSVLENSPYFDMERFSIPYIHFAQKEIPEEVLKAENIPAELNTQFQFYDSLQYGPIYRYRFHDLTHSYFSSYGVLFANRDKRQDKSDAKLMASYKLLSKHTLQFLKAFLNEDKAAKKFIENSPEQNELDEGMVSKMMKAAVRKSFTYKDFNDAALAQDYQSLIPLYQKLKERHPTLMLEEGMLNTLGLRKSFNPNTLQQGIQVFLLALHIYPKSANLYDSIAEAYLLNRDTKNAITNFKKSLELNPENQNAISRLKQLDN